MSFPVLFGQYQAVSNPQSRAKIFRIKTGDNIAYFIARALYCKFYGTYTNYTNICLAIFNNILIIRDIKITFFF